MFNKSYKFRIYPTNKQKVLINKTFGCVRYAWNQWVEYFNKPQNQYKNYKTTKQLRDQTIWMKEISFTAVQQKENDFKEYKRQFFNKNRKIKIGKPKFKSRKSKQSYRLSNIEFYLQENYIRLSKIGFVKIILDRQIPKDAKFVNVTISKDKYGDYFASINVEQNIQEKHKTGKEVGIDVGIKSFAVLSDETYIDNPKYFSENQVKIKKLQQHLNRKQEGSNKWKKNRLKLNETYRKISRQRLHFLHNVSSFIVNEYDIIAIENLNVRGMLKNHKLAKGIQDASWAQFFRQLEYKRQWYGKQIRKVYRFEPTSKTCHICNYIKDDMTLRNRQWTCPNCNTKHDRDLNARKNILDKSKPVGVNAGLQTQRECKTPKKTDSKLFPKKCLELKI